MKWCMNAPLSNLLFVFLLLPLLLLQEQLTSGISSLVIHPTMYKTEIERGNNFFKLVQVHPREPQEPEVPREGRRHLRGRAGA